MFMPIIHTIEDSTYHASCITASEATSFAMTTLSFAVRRREPVLVAPARPTPRGAKRLSDIDGRESPQSYMPAIFIYRGGDGQPARGDPVVIIRQALSEALVHYYPLAGRIREVVGGRGLVVDCTGDGVMFAEAEANVRLEELEAAGLRLPFPCNMDQLQLDVDGALDCPLFMIQVTRLVCGGFIVGVRLCHTICDGLGFAQFLDAIADLARGLPSPAIAPAWSRELLAGDGAACIPTAPIINSEPTAHDDMVIRSFIFGPAEIAVLKTNLSLPGLRGATTRYELLAASLWIARTRALALLPGQDAVLTVIGNFRRNAALRLPAGYYGNACAPVRAVAPAGALTGGSLDDAVELVRKAKAAAGHIRSVADLLLLHGTRPLPVPEMFRVSDLRHLGFHRLDFGWGKPLYGGPAQVMFWETFLVSVKSSSGEDEDDDDVAVPVALPRPAMDRFVEEMNSLLKA